VIDESDCIRIFGLVEQQARAMMKIRAWGANRLARPEKVQGVVRLDPTPVWPVRHQFEPYVAVLRE